MVEVIRELWELFRKSVTRLRAFWRPILWASFFTPINGPHGRRRGSEVSTVFSKNFKSPLMYCVLDKPLICDWQAAYAILNESLSSFPGKHVVLLAIIRATFSVIVNSSETLIMMFIHIIS